MINRGWARNMNSEVLIYMLIFEAGVLISGVSQVMLKKAALVKYDSWIREYLNVRVIVAYAIFFIATLLSIYAYKVIPLSMGPVLDSTGYIFVTFFGVTIFKEKITLKKCIALVLIISGILVYSLLG